jgi:histidinol-phosphate aminotransferase
VPLTDDFRLPVDAFLPQGERAAGGVVFANPNAPTGIALELAEVERIVAGNPQCVVLVDEAYVDFGAQSAIPLVTRYPNLLVVQTFSKSRALAGLRVGYAIGQAPLIEALRRLKDSFNSYPLDRLAQVGALASLQDEAHFEAMRLDVIATRASLARGLEALGFEVLPSQANFVFARHRERSGAELAQSLRERKVLVRRFDQPRIADFLRITVGTREQCARLLEALAEILGG